MDKNLSFIFKGYNVDLKKGEILFNFGIKGEENIDFKERISFNPIDRDIPQEVLKPVLGGLMLILGISYWKTYCPKEIIIESNFLTKKQAEFWNTVYTKGLGEFFFKNNIDFRGLVQFPFVSEDESSSSIPFPRSDRYLLLLGGGKDSIVAAEVLKGQDKNFDILTVGTSDIQEDVARVMSKKPIVIKRELDPKLFELNGDKKVFNGHIPISVVYGFLGLLASVLYDYRFVIVGNERSANYGNLEYLGEIVNHQWSKSEEFETLFREYIHNFVTPDISYSSILRSLSEMEVTKKFVEHPEYFGVFSSCNTNFKISAPLRSGELRRGKWCGKCAKCLFVFIMLAAYLPREKIIEIFGKDLFEDESLVSMLKKLAGLKDAKPFECVGTPEEVSQAIAEIEKRGEFNDSVLMKSFKNK